MSQQAVGALAMRQIKYHLKHLEKQIAQIDAELQTLIDKDPEWKERVELIDTRFLVADAGFGSEDNRAVARQRWQVRSGIPPKIGRPSTTPRQGRFRRLRKKTIRPQSLRQDLRPAVSERDSQQHDGAEPGRFPSLDKPTPLADQRESSEDRCRKTPSPSDC